jgi:predicted RNA polymerase sigma factor
MSEVSTAVMGLVDGLDLDRYHLFHAICADPLQRLGRARPSGTGLRNGDRPYRQRDRTRFLDGTRRPAQPIKRVA